MTQEQYEILSRGFAEILEQQKEMIQLLNACTSCGEPVVGPEKGECKGCI